MGVENFNFVSNTAARTSYYGRPDMAVGAYLFRESIAVVGGGETSFAALPSDGDEDTEYSLNSHTRWINAAETAYELEISRTVCHPALQHGI